MKFNLQKFEELIRARDTTIPYYAMIVTIPIALLYSFKHLAWFLAKFEPDGSLFGYVGALMIEFIAFGLSFALAKIGRGSGRGRGVIWGLQIFFLLFVALANFFHAVVNYSKAGPSALPSLELLSKMNWFDMTLCAVFGSVPPFVIFAGSYCMMLFSQPVTRGPVASRPFSQPVTRGPVASRPFSQPVTREPVASHPEPKPDDPVQEIAEPEAPPKPRKKVARKKKAVTEEAISPGSHRLPIDDGQEALL